MTGDASEQSWTRNGDDANASTTDTKTADNAMGADKRSGSGMTTVGTAWESVALLSNNSSASQLTSLLGTAKTVALPVGGSAQFLFTSLINVLLADDGRVAVGAIDAATLAAALKASPTPAASVSSTSTPGDVTPAAKPAVTPSRGMSGNHVGALVDDLTGAVPSKQGTEPTNDVSSFRSTGGLDAALVASAGGASKTLGGSTVPTANRNPGLTTSYTWAIETNGLTKKFGEATVVDGINLRVPKGSVFGFLGPNGSGKTTTIRMLLGLISSNAGVRHTGCAYRYAAGFLADGRGHCGRRFDLR